MEVDLEQLVAATRALPLSDDGAVEAIIAACDDPEMPVARLGEAVARDPAVATMILSQANSAALGRRTRAETIEEACIVLGVAAIRTLAVTRAMMNFLTLDRDGLVPYRRALLGHSLATSTAARGLARRCGAVPERAFLVGLVHEIGAIALTRVARPLFLHAVVTARSNDIAFHRALRDIAGFDDAEFGSRLADEWRLPPVVVDAIRAHREPATARLERLLCETLHVADWIAAEAGYGLDLPGHPAWPDSRAADAVGLTPESLQTCLDEAVPAYSAA